MVLVQYKPGAFPASSNAADAAWMDFGAEAVVFGLSSNADYFFGYRSPATRLWSVWRRDGNECARLGPVGNDVWLTLRGISDDGLTAAGVSWSGGAQPVLTPIVWRAGELPRTLRSVFRRFGATQAAYYNLTDLLGVSTDGKTILGYATSPWFGSAAFIATIPEWSPCASDFDFDGVVSDEDFVIFAAAYDDLDTTACDLNTDNRTDDLDFVLFAGAYDVLVCP